MSAEIGGAGAGLVGPSIVDLLEILGATSSTDVHVVAANTGLLIRGRAVHPGFSGGRIGAVDCTSLKLVVELSSELRAALHLGTVLMLVLIATVGIVGGGGAGLVGSGLFG